MNTLSDLTVMVKTFLRPEMIKRFLVSIGEYQNKRRIKFAKIIVGDDSDEATICETEQVINEIQKIYPDLNINYQKYEFYIGCSDGRNRMIDSITTKYFLYCDDDYIFDNDCDFAEVINLLEEKQVDLLSGWCKNYNELNADYHIINFMGQFDLQSDAVTCFIYNDYLPEFYYADYHTNYYIAKTDKIKNLKWDADLKTEEHPEFFLRAYRNKLNMAFTNKLFIKHHHEKSKKYEKFRSVNKGGKNYLFLRLKKSNVRIWTAFYINNDVIRKWVVDYDKKISNHCYYFISPQSKIDFKRRNALVPVYSQRVSIERLSPEFEHFFFGYYDIKTVREDGSHHLALNVSFMDRLSNSYEPADICIIDDNKVIRKIDKTYAWNFQQGAFVQYRPGSDKEILYNIYDEGDNRYKSILFDLETEKKKILPLPIANVSPDGKKALSINFSRLYDYRPGYGYCQIKDPHYNEVKPKDDGVFLIDIESGEYKLILSYEKLWEMFAKGTKNKNDKMLINHINFNTDGTRFLMLLRFFSGTPPFPTLTVTADTNGENVHKIFGFGSHYHWKDSKNLVISGANIHNRNELKSLSEMTAYELEDILGKYTAIDPEFFIGDGHCSYSPDRRYMLYDSYNSKQFPYRKLQIYDLKKKKGITLGYFYSDPDLYKNITDCRCDLHPRWSSCGNYITFDSIHEGFRGIYRIDANEAIGEIERDIELLSEDDIRKIVRSNKTNVKSFAKGSLLSIEEMKAGLTAKQMTIEIIKRLTKRLKIFPFAQKVARVLNIKG